MLAAIGDAFSGVLESPVVTGSLFAIGIGLVVLWLAAAWWAYLDISRRAEPQLARMGAVALVLLSSPALLPFSMLVYLLVRPQTTVAERRSIGLIGGLSPYVSSGVSCPECQARVDPEWRRCPACAAWLATPCASCDGWSEPEADVCPWCAATKDEPAQPAAASAFTAPGAAVGLHLAPAAFAGGRTTPAAALPPRQSRRVASKSTSRGHGRAAARRRFRESGASVRSGGPVGLES
jgi:hypothetical protein